MREYPGAAALLARAVLDAAHSTGTLVRLVTGFALTIAVLLLATWSVLRMSRDSNVGELTFPKGIGVKFQTAQGTRVIATVHANRLLGNGIPIDYRSRVTVRAEGTISTGPGFDDWGYSPTTLDYYARATMGLDLCSHECEALAVPLARSLLRSRLMDDMNPRWRGPDGHLLSGIEEDQESFSAADAHAYSKAAKILADEPWGALLGTLAPNAGDAFANIKEQSDHSWASLGKVDKPRSPRKVFAVRNEIVLKMTESTAECLEGTFCERNSIAQAGLQATELKLFLFVNDGIVDSERLKQLEQVATSEEARASYRLQREIHDAALSKRVGKEQDTTIEAYLAGLWYLNNRGHLTVYVEIPKG